MKNNKVGIMTKMIKKIRMTIFYKITKILRVACVDLEKIVTSMVTTAMMIMLNVEEKYKIGR